MANKIRTRRMELTELIPIDLDPQLQSIRGSIDGEMLFIRNELHRCKGLRKLHLELAILGSGLQILHCVFFPEPTFDIPIFGADVVAGPLGISAAIVDLSPVGRDLPILLQRKLENLPVRNFAQNRQLPAWGNIFSSYVQFIRPSGLSEEALFLNLVDDYLKILVDVLQSTHAESVDSASTIERYQAQFSYCLQQKRNDKTRSVLAKAFNPQWADRYIDKLLFETPPPLA